MDLPQSDFATRPMVDNYGRTINYLRLSVTDRCDLRCVYCMKARPKFLPKADLLSLEELTTICDAFIRRGVTKIRLTGGEPLVRRDVLSLIDNLGARIGVAGLEELCLTTNANMLPRYAGRLAKAGIKRINVSLDTLDPARYAALTRRGTLESALRGIDAAQTAGLNVKINAVALKGDNEGELPQLIEWAHGRAMDLTLIEVMPMGEVDASRNTQFLPLTEVRERLEQQWTLTDQIGSTGGPARYVSVKETGGRLGFISPLTNNFCAGCNRIRVSCAGELFSCLGRNGKLDLRNAFRTGGMDAVDGLIDQAMATKPARHDFTRPGEVGDPVSRSMAHTGG
ncbi:MAG: GTP 3',8-cyclase MoaA [Maricaulis sp.]|nr:GTP 3',8-cyclase MoaA [Maricaulis sp.]MDG2044007.1 GTP 3',8-cyclase MoaA [Maricaulis sp.]